MAPRDLVVAVASIAIVAFGAEIGYSLTVRPAGVVFLWPPSGLVLAALVLLPRRDWPAVLLGALLGNALVDAAHGATIPLAFAGSLTNAGEQLIGALTLRWLCGPRFRIGSLREVGALLVVVIGTNAVTALIGALVLRAYGTESLFQAWFNWWTGDGMGMLIVTPVILAWAPIVAEPRRIETRRLVEGALVLATVAVTASVLLSPAGLMASRLVSSAYLIFPVLIWSGVRFGPWGSAHATLALVSVAAWHGTLSDIPLLSGAQTSFDQVMELYSYLALAALSSMVPAAVLAEREEAASGLRESEQRFREIADHVHEAFFVADIALRRTLYVSARWASIWQRPLDEGYDPSTWFDAIVEEDREPMLEAMSANAQGQTTSTTFRIRRPSGELRWLRGRAFPVRDPDGVVRRVVGLTEDITERREIEERSLQAQKLEAVGLLAGGVAHDFNNLLTVIFAESDQLADERHLSPQARESAREIRRTAESAASLTRQLLAFSRHQLIEPLSFDLNDVVRDVTKMLRRLIGEDIVLEVHLWKGRLGVHMDRGQLEQVITNLAVNARDAMPRGGTLRIESYETLDETPEVALLVADSGVGMSDEVLARAFEPFFTTKEMGRGTGLGLATCDVIARQAGGRIELLSSLGAGTKVKVVLPRVDLPTVEPARPDETSLPRGNERILLVEDETGVRHVTARVLRAQGYEVIEARDGTEALQLLRNESRTVSLLMTDMVLPGMSGRDLAERVHKSMPGLPTLFATGYTEEQFAPDELASGDTAFLQKPFTRHALVRRIRDLLDGARR